MGKLLVAGLGGFIGSAGRYWISTYAYRVMGQDFPYGTLVVNVSGCFLIGLLAAFFEDRFLVNPGLRVFLTVGILGGFTTFSSFSYETMALLKESSYFLASANIFLNLFICLAATWIGSIFGKIL